MAFSGGLDSRFLCHAARLCGCDVLALHAAGPHGTQEESRAALQWAQERSLPLVLLNFNPLLLPEVAINSRERCYACKRALIAAMRAALAQRGETARLLCDGSNADDLNAFRPGLRALAEFGVRSPLAEAGLSKAEIRTLAGLTDLDNPGSEPALPADPAGVRPCARSGGLGAARRGRSGLVSTALAGQRACAWGFPPAADPGACLAGQSAARKDAAIGGRYFDQSWLYPVHAA